MPAQHKTEVSQPNTVDAKPKHLLLSLAIVLIVFISLVTSLFFKEQWLWMDEVLSYLLVSDPSIAHLNDAVVSGMDANPPLFVNLYWLIGHTVSLDPQFLRAVSVVIFAVTIALLYRYTTKLVGTPVWNFVFITGIVSLTYLNLTLSTQIRAYSLLLLVSLGYFVCAHQLITSPTRTRLLVLFSITGILLVLTHNFGLFYLAASGLFFGGLFLWSKQRNYVYVLASHFLIGLVWLLLWYPSFAIQTEAGKPHSWIPLPTFQSFFITVGELMPGISSSLEHKPTFVFLPIARFLIIVGLWLYIALPRLKNGFKDIINDKAFLFFLLAGFMYLATISIALVVTFVHTSVFISRYFWPDHLLIIYLLVYAAYFFLDRWHVQLSSTSLALKLLPVYALLLGGFLFYQNRKASIFPSGILSYLPGLDKRYPVFVESADYFLPIWYHNKSTKIRFLLDWETAMQDGNILNATVHHNILKSVREKYHVGNIIPEKQFNRASVPHFYVIDESSTYQFEHFIESGRVRVIRQLPIGIEGHRILECVYL